MKLHEIHTKNRDNFVRPCNALHDNKKIPKTIFPSCNYPGADGNLVFSFSLTTPTPCHPVKTPLEDLISVHFGSVLVRSGPFGSVWLRFGSVSGPFRVHFGVLGGVGVGSGRRASVREKNITTLINLWVARKGGHTLRKGVFLPSKRLLRSTSFKEPSKNPSKKRAVA